MVSTQKYLLLSSFGCLFILQFSFADCSYLLRLQLPPNRLRNSRMRRLRIYVGNEHPHQPQVCPSVQYEFTKYTGRRKAWAEEPQAATPEMWETWQKEIEAANNDPDVLMAKYGGVQATYDMRRNVMELTTHKGS